MYAKTSYLNNIYGTRSVDVNFKTLIPPADFASIFAQGTRMSQLVTPDNNLHTHPISRGDYTNTVTEPNTPIKDTKEWVFARKYMNFLDHLNKENHQSITNKEERISLGYQIMTMGTDVLNNLGGSVNIENSDWDKIKANEYYKSQNYITGKKDNNLQDHQKIFQVVIVGLLISIALIILFSRQ